MELLSVQGSGRRVAPWGTPKRLLAVERSWTSGPLCGFRRVGFVTHVSLGGAALPHPPGTDGVHELPGTPSVTSPSSPIFCGADSWPGCFCGVAAPLLPEAKFLSVLSLSGLFPGLPRWVMRPRVTRVLCTDSRARL